ncbi:Hsp20 family protein [Pelagibius sp. Alg239-R121]|uniref:Hsp20 family protein n=1 Tax=Pelagibius sp. Alg239-R121 TaxID=2993448 RepID=UPI0024A60B39|nr:Hsp20 family protein [Pelagibius sp. Alg239-R121]
MTRMSLFNSPLMLGFEQFEQAIDRISKTASDGYPPYNVEKLADNRLRITLAVAGFTSDDMQVQIESNQLVIHGKQKDDQSRVYLHRGIAARQFHRSFVLADGVEVSGASLDNGLLHIDLEWPQIEPAVKTIAIRSAETSKSLELPALKDHGADD